MNQRTDQQENAQLPNAAELTDELRGYASACLDRANELGCDGFEISLVDSRGVSVDCRRQRLEAVEFSNDFYATIRVCHQKRRASATVSERSVSALLKALQEALEVSRLTEVDPLYGLPEAEEMCADASDLQLYYPITPDVRAMEDMALRCEQAGFDYDAKITNSEGAGVNCSQSVSVFANSHGVMLDHVESNHQLSVILLASDKESQESQYYFSRARQYEHLTSAEDIGREAARRAVAHLRPRKPATAALPVIYSAETAGSFLGHLLDANDGSSIKRGESFLIGQLGQQVANTRLTMAEKPRATGGLASRCHDLEGVTTREKLFVDRGRLLTHSLDSYHARYLNQKTSGNCGGVTNIEVETSDRSLDDLISAAGRGLLITDLIGFGVNTTTGDYSRGASGFWFDNGQIQYPVNECTVACRLSDAYAAIEEIADDRWPHHNINTGSVLIGQMMVGGGR